jgi:mannosylglycerate hydrolase
VNCQDDSRITAGERTGSDPRVPPADARRAQIGVDREPARARPSARDTAEPQAYELHVICQTHWDREWRLPFQQTRLMLVDMMDHLLEAMHRDPALRYFHLDGQTILLEDYLEIRPEQRPALADLVAKGRLLIGPWYTLPEENLVTGECLIRNLLMGHRIGQEFNGVMKAGFTPTSYGQTAQMPQIYAGFGIDTIFFHRGVPAHEVGVEYIWEGSDGSRLLALRPPLGGRFNFTSLVTSPLFTSPDRNPDTCIPYNEIPADDLSHSIGLKGADNASEVYYSSRVPGTWDRATLRQAVLRLKTLAARNARTPCLYCGEGHDWMELNPLLPALVAEVGSLLEGDKVMISSLPELFARVRASLSNPAVLKGEMRSTQKDESGARLYASTLSSLLPLKQMNRRVEDVLLRWAEPFSALAWALGAPYPGTALQKAWKYLLANHAHDSISGTGTDEVHADVMSRFAQCEQMAAELARRSLSDIVSRIDDPELVDGDVLLTVFNPLPFPRDEVIHLDLDLPEDDSSEFVLSDHLGNPVACHRDPAVKTIHTVHQTHGFPYRFSVHRQRLWLRARTIPALGYTTYLVKRNSGTPAPMGPAAEADRVEIIGPNRMENHSVAVQIHPDGTLTIHHKPTGRCYEKLHVFEDTGEVGNAYEHRPPLRDRRVSSLSGKACVELIHQNPLTASFAVKLSLDIPEGATEDKTARAAGCRPCAIASTVTLTAGSSVVEIVTQVNNTAKDHRLRVLFPTGLRTGEHWAETPFDVQRRQAATPPSGNWIEPPSATHPQLNFIDLSNGNAGLAVLNHGLPEYEIIDDGRNTIALTLLRCFAHETRVTRTDDPHQIGTQCLGRHEFRYALFPHAGNWQEGNVFREAYGHRHRVKVAQSWRPVRRDRPARPLPLQRSFLQMVPDSLVLSAVKRAEDGGHLIVRCFNPTDQAVDGELHVYRDVVGAWCLDLEEHPLGNCRLKDGRTVSFLAGPKKIVTIGLDLAPS